ncbi:MAG: hypothetical protein WC047_00405 [Kiritimatiellales bacterium]
MIRIEMEEIELKPVSRKGIMQLDAMCRMTESQMYGAVESFKEYITSETWGRWLDEWKAEADDLASFPVPANPDEEAQWERDRAQLVREGNALADAEVQKFWKGDRT